MYFLRTLVNGMQILVNYPILLTHGGNIDVSFVLSSKRSPVCNSSSSVSVLNRKSPSLLHTFVEYTTQLSITIQHTGNSYLHQHIPRTRLRASSCLLYLLSLIGIFFYFDSSRRHTYTTLTRDRDANSSLQNDVTWCTWFLQGKLACVAGVLKGRERQF